MAETLYHITVGEINRPPTIKIGTVERNTGQSIIKERGETLAKRGDAIFPNGTKIWAARVIDGKIPTDDKGNFILIAPTDPKYKGEIKRLKWGEKGGSLIDVRYVKGLYSLDVLYQERILNFKVDDTNESSAEVYFIMFPNGDNDINESIEPLFVEHLRGHSYNRDSKSKDPTFMTYTFWEKSFEQEEALDSKVLDAKFEAQKIVREAGTGTQATAKCKNLFSIIKVITDEEPADNKLFAYLKMIADKKPAQLLKAVEDYKLKVSNMIVKLESYDAVDLTTPGTIVATKPGKPETVSTNIPGKGKEMTDYLMDNICEPEAFDATYKLIKITDKLK